MGTERFLITGALGCLGAWTLRDLRERSIDVIAVNRTLSLDRIKLVLESETFDGITFAQCDISDAESVERVFAEHSPTHVIHLAALQIPFCQQDPALGARVNVQGTVNIFEAVRKRTSQIAGLVYSGSVAMYGPSDDDRVQVDEGAEPHPGTHYGVYKRANENSAAVYWDQHGVPSVGLRPMVVFGVGRDQGRTSATTLAMRAAAAGEPFEIPYGGSNFFNYAPDVAHLFVDVALASAEGAQVYNVPGSRQSIASVVTHIEQAIGGANVTWRGDPLPFPSEIAFGGVSALANVTPTPFDVAVAETVAHFQRNATIR